MSERRTNAGATWRRLSALASTVLVAAMLGVAACGGDDDEEKVDGSGSRSTATEGTGGREETPDATEDGDGGGGDAASDLSALAENYEDFTGVVNYRTTGFGDASFTSMKIYKGENASRVDYESAAGTGTIITTEDAIYICAVGACIKYGTGNTSLDPTAGLTALLSAQSIAAGFGDIPDGVDVEESSEEIGGVDATCYAYSGDVDETESGDENGEICVSESGLLLKLVTDATSGGGIFEATEATDDVSDDDFKPPFPVTEIPNFGQ